MLKDSHVLAFSFVFNLLSVWCCCDCEWTRNLLEYDFFLQFLHICTNMKYTLLELIGLASIGTVSWFVLREVWKFLYSTFIGHALGRSLSLKNIGQWAGRSKTCSILCFNKSMTKTNDLTSYIFLSCDRCHRRNRSSIRRRGIYNRLRDSLPG